MYTETSTFLIMSFEAFLQFLEQAIYKVVLQLNNVTEPENNSTVLILLMHLHFFNK